MLLGFLSFSRVLSRDSRRFQRLRVLRRSKQMWDCKCGTAAEHDFHPKHTRKHGGRYRETTIYQGFYNDFGVFANAAAVGLWKRARSCSKTCAPGNSWGRLPPVPRFLNSKLLLMLPHCARNRSPLNSKPQTSPES